MKKKLLAIICLGIFSGCALKDNQDLVLFDSSTPIETVSSPYGTRYETKEGILWVSNDRNIDYSGISIEGNWDLSESIELVLEIVNSSDKTFPMYVRMESPGITGKSKKGIYVEKHNAEVDIMQKIRVAIPPQFPHPEIEDKLFGMRTSPYKSAKCYYGLKGQESSLNPAAITQISIYAGSRNVDIRWGIKRIIAKTGKPEKLPEWTNLPENKFFPFIDKYGQFIHKDWPGKTKSDDDLKKTLKEELTELETNPGPPDHDKYGGWKNGPRQEATGNFYVKKIDGKWWMVDPDGYLFWSHAVLRVTPSSAVTPLDNREFYFADLPSASSPLAEFYTTRDELLYPYYVARGIKKTYDFSAANIFRKYGNNWRNKYAGMAHKRLKSWGLNTIANSSDRFIYLMDKTPYCERIELKSPDIEGSDNGWWKFKDPFHPDFRNNFRKQLEEQKKELDDPWCMGFFVDNEILWGGETSLAEWVLLSPSTQPAKIEFVSRLKKKYGKIERLNKSWGTNYNDFSSLLGSQVQPPSSAHVDCIDFTAAVTEAYFKNIRDEFKKIAPNKLYMGCRFSGSNKTVLQIAAKYCDVLSYNIYRYTLFDFSLPEGIDKPVMIGEFHFGALDRGMFHYSLKPTVNQQERGWAYKTYVESALCHPNIIGTHWHQFSDQPTTGRFDGENFQNGFTDVCDRPYPETIEKIREVGYDMYNIRSRK